ncbi:MULTISPECIES: NAD-dependent epimerase/dehydratase family protein [unclassified Streptomyces]|uniref:NAD-dependent epimerase/dehydratase family protein n=1 Tax=unclassified Streptomyces TaxID=2593676 RepID=UPI0024A7DFF0|nr:MULTISPECIES: NAD-dependent epimerase/dehydratase family protein [unclassified Streptomyces]
MADDAAKAPLVVVLGASGYIGSAVVAQFARRPVRLRLVGREAPHPLPDAPAWTETCAADLTRPDEARRAVAGADVVLHLVARLGAGLAWRVAEEDPVAAEVNMGAMRNVLSALSAEPRATGEPPPVVVFAGSAAQSGVAGRVSGGEPDRPVTVYARQKLAAEHLLKEAVARGTVRGVSVRLPTVYGAAPGSLGKGVVTAMAACALDGKPLTVWREGAGERDLLHVTDAARALVLAADRANVLSGHHWLAGTGRPVAVAELFALIAAAVAARTGQPPVPVREVAPPASATLADARGMDVDSSAFRAATRWRPRARLVPSLDALVAAMVRRRGPGAGTQRMCTPGT